MKKIWRKLSFILIAVLICAQCSLVSFAYFERGDVLIKVGKQTVTLEQGSAETVSVTFTPSSSRQLPGCGMAECPQSCGEKECLDENGECTCNGTTYQTYYAYATAASSNTSVATATYNNGVVTIKGVAPGTATITLTAFLRQFTSTTTSIKVTVNKKSSSSQDSSSSSGSQNSGSQGSSGQNTGSQTSGSSSSNTGSSSSSTGSNASQTNGGSVSVKPIAGSQTTSDGQESGVTDQTDDAESLPSESEQGEITVLNSDRGKIIFVPISDGVQGKEQFEEILGQKAYVDFQLKDAAGTVIYAWEFCGEDISSAEDMNFNIEKSTNAFEGCSYGSAADTLYLSFAQEGNFLGKASVFMKVNELFSDEQTLYLYEYNADEDTVQLIQGDLNCENGYITMQMEHGGYYILTTQIFEDVQPDGTLTTTATSENDRNVNPGIFVAIAIVIAAVIYLCTIFMKKRKKGGNE